MNIKHFIYTLVFLFTFISCEKEEDSNPPYTVHDAEFHRALLELFDTDNDDELSTEEANIVKEIDFNGRAFYCTSFQDLEKFPNLEKLSLQSFHGFETLDLTQNPKLKILSIKETGAKLNLSKNTELEELYYTNCTNVKTIDLSNNPKLRILDCSNNSEFKSLDLQHNPELVELNISNLLLDNFNLGDKPELLIVDVRKTGFSEFMLNLSSAPKLKTLLFEESDGMPLTLDVRSTSIEELIIPSNILNINAKGCKYLKFISCSSLASFVDVSESGIEEISYAPIKIEYDALGPGEEFDPSKFHAVDPWADPSPVLLMNNCPNLKEFYYYQEITRDNWEEQGKIPDHMGRIRIDISNCESLIKFSANHVAELKIDNCPALKEFSCKGSYNQP